MENALRIGEVASRSGVSIDTVRFYERRSLLPVAPRTAGGYRVFTTEAIERIQFIKQAQELGFSLDDIAMLLTTNGESDCLRVHDLLDTKVREIDNRMKSMVEFRKKLIHCLAECEEELKKHPTSADCPVVVGIGHAKRK